MRLWVVRVGDRCWCGPVGALCASFVIQRQSASVDALRRCRRACHNPCLTAATGVEPVHVVVDAQLTRAFFVPAKTPPILVAPASDLRGYIDLAPSQSISKLPPSAGLFGLGSVAGVEARGWKSAVFPHELPPERTNKWEACKLVSVNAILLPLVQVPQSAASSPGFPPGSVMMFFYQRYPKLLRLYQGNVINILGRGLCTAV
ncbi:unnamed protein product, partial [Ectocarpus sp. 12 AP-2014]